jgi:glycosyltransferase involved in cell wall biosynthesis
VAVLIPALNEEASLPGVLAAIPRDTVQHVVVADNGSTDRTAEVARDSGATVVAEPRRGYGAACLAGLTHLADLPTAPAVVAFLDADQSDDPGEIRRLVDPILAGTADMVIGIRESAGGGQRSVPAHARLGNALVLGLARVLFGARFQDLGPYRAIRFESLRSLEMDDQNWGWTLQMQIRAALRGLRVLEIPVSHRERAAGTSKVSGSAIGSVQAGGKMLYTLVRERLRAPRGSR